MLKPFFQDISTEAGCDEAGRGCLAGPVFAAAVILKPGYSNAVLNDSKILSRKKRDELRLMIEKEAMAWAVARVEAEEIDRINILNASIVAMHRAVSQLHIQPGFLLIDGNRFRTYNGISYRCFVKGDSIYQSIAAASVLAKTHRDEYMLQLHEQFPLYRWNKNMGYPTLEHRRAVLQNGPSPYHRLSFKVSEQLRLF